MLFNTRNVNIILDAFYEHKLKAIKIEGNVYYNVNHLINILSKKYNTNYDIREWFNDERTKSLLKYYAKDDNCDLSYNNIFIPGTIANIYINNKNNGLWCEGRLLHDIRMHYDPEFMLNISKFIADERRNGNFKP